VTGTILIAGGGIGGLAAALALAKEGFAVKLFESRARPEEAGAGLQIGANGAKALRWLGLEAAATARATQPEAIELRLPGSGRVVTRVGLGLEHATRYGARYLHMHRGDLHDVLMAAAVQHEAIELVLGRKVVDVVHTLTSAKAVLDDGETISGDALIGADGVGSTVREGVAGLDEPRFTGMVAWRATVPMLEAERARLPVGTVWMGAGKHLVHYPLTARGEMNLIGVVEDEDWQGESWSEPGDPEAMRAAFAGWHDEVDSLLARVTSPWKWALHERPLLSVWCAGRIALLGDACHAMPPFLAQGACMALEDAVVLARRMAAEPDNLTGALREYASARHDRTAQVQRASWANAWRFHLRQPVMRTLVYGALGAASWVAPSRPGRMFDWLYSYDAATA
jgi:salicylate hydroxylase